MQAKINVQHWGNVKGLDNKNLTDLACSRKLVLIVMINCWMLIRIHQTQKFKTFTRTSSLNCNKRGLYSFGPTLLKPVSALKKNKQKECHLKLVWLHVAFSYDQYIWPKNPKTFCFLSSPLLLPFFSSFFLLILMTCTHLYFSIRCFPEVPGDCKGILKEAQVGRWTRFSLEFSDWSTLHCLTVKMVSRVLQVDGMKKLLLYTYMQVQFIVSEFWAQKCSSLFWP